MTKSDDTDTCAIGEGPDRHVVTPERVLPTAYSGSRELAPPVPVAYSRVRRSLAPDLSSGDRKRVVTCELIVSIFTRPPRSTPTTPVCAMGVQRSFEGGPLSLYTPPASCTCKYDSLVDTTSCATCSPTVACASGVCRSGYCEVQ